MKTHDRTFENSLCIAYTNCKVKRANEATEPEMSATTIASQPNHGHASSTAHGA